jgi:TolB-like protein
VLPLRDTAAEVQPRAWRSGARLAVGVAGVITAVVLGGLLTLQLIARPSTKQLALAVLPFQNRSADPEQEFFSEGFTDELIAHVGRLSPNELRVIARASTTRYDRTSKTVDQIGRELGVDYVLEGSVLPAELRKSIELSGSNSHYVAMLACAQALAGDRQAPLAALATLDARARTGYVSSHNLALLHASAGQQDLALDALDRAFRERDPWLSLINVQPQFNPLAGHTRFRDLMRRLGLAAGARHAPVSSTITRSRDPRSRGTRVV